MTSDWSRAVFRFSSDTNIEERRLLAHNFSLDLFLGKKTVLKNFSLKMDILASRGLNFKRRQNLTAVHFSDQIFKNLRLRAGGHVSCVVALPNQSAGVYVRLAFVWGLEPTTETTQGRLIFRVQVL